MYMYSYLELNEISAAMNNIDLSINDKLSWAIVKNQRKLAKVLAEAHKKATNLNIQFAQTDENGILITDKGEFRYTKDSLIKRNEAAEELSNTKVEFEFYKATDDVRAKELPINLQEVLEGKLW